MRKPLIAGNWKMNLDVPQAIDLVKDLGPQIAGSNGVDVVICPPATALDSVTHAIEISNLNVHVGAQNMYFEESGAYTGEVSPMMLEDIGIEYIIIGHSERREIFGETDEMVNKKIKAALDNGLKPIVCVGETLEEREQDKTQEKIKKQVLAALGDVSPVEGLIFAYEPIWAIGTGKVATAEQANDVIRFIRALISSKAGPEIAAEIRILYGGSVSPDNVKELMNEPEIDGALVGGASLKADSFSKIVNFKS